MKNVVFVPPSCKKEGAAVTGQLVLRMPSFDERWGYIESCNFEVDEAGQMKKGSNVMSAFRKLVSISKDHYVKVELKKQDGTTITSYDEMQFDTDCDSILIDVATQLMHGFKVGKI